MKYIELIPAKQNQSYNNKNKVILMYTLASRFLENILLCATNQKMLKSHIFGYIYIYFRLCNIL